MIESCSLVSPQKRKRAVKNRSTMMTRKIDSYDHSPSCRSAHFLLPRPLVDNLFEMTQPAAMVILNIADFTRIRW